MNDMVDFKQGTGIDVGSGSKTSFWRDCWCTHKLPMLESPLLVYLARDKEARVRDYWAPLGNAGTWNVELRKRLNDWGIVEMGNLLGVIDPIFLRLDREDRLFWFIYKNGVFSATSWREARWARDGMDPSWSLLWKLKIQ